MSQFFDFEITVDRSTKTKFNSRGKRKGNEKGRQQTIHHGDIGVLGGVHQGGGSADGITLVQRRTKIEQRGDHAGFVHVAGK